jgi:O-antigen/teichoic acid export membrane protein
MQPHILGFRAVQASLVSKPAVMFGGLMLANAIAYLYHMAMARLLAPADYGVLVTLLSLSYVLAVLMRSFQAWVIKAVAATSGASDGQPGAVFMIAMRTLVPLGAAALVGHWLASGWVATFLHLDTPTPVIVLGLYAFSSFIVPVPRGMLIGLGRLHMASLIYVLEPAVRLLAGIGLVAWGLRVNGAITGYAIGNLIVFAIALLPMRALLYRASPQAHPADNARMLDRYTLLVLIVNACLALISNIDQIAVKHFFSEQVAGNYAVAFLLGQIISMTTGSLGWVIFARAALLPPDDPRHRGLLMRGLLVIGALASMLTAGYLLAPLLAIRLMGGAQYTLAHTYVGLVGIETTLFAFVYVQAYYHISVKRTEVVWPLCLALVLQIVLLLRFHSTVEQVQLSLIGVMAGLLICMSGFSWWVLRTNSRQPLAVVEALSEVAAES